MRSQHVYAGTGGLLELTLGAVRESCFPARPTLYPVRERQAWCVSIVLRAGARLSPSGTCIDSPDRGADRKASRVADKNVASCRWSICLAHRKAMFYAALPSRRLLTAEPKSSRTGSTRTRRHARTKPGGLVAVQHRLFVYRADWPAQAARDRRSLPALPQEFLSCRRPLRKRGPRRSANSRTASSPASTKLYSASLLLRGDSLEPTPPSTFHLPGT
jgi:hypothetical protein